MLATAVRTHFRVADQSKTKTTADSNATSHTALSRSADRPKWIHSPLSLVSPLLRAARRSAAAAAARLATRPRVGGASTCHDRGVAGARLSSLLGGTTARCSSGSVSSAGAGGGVARVLFTSGGKEEGVADTGACAAPAGGFRSGCACITGS